MRRPAGAANMVGCRLPGPWTLAGILWRARRVVIDEAFVQEVKTGAAVHLLLTLPSAEPGLKLKVSPAGDRAAAQFLVQPFLGVGGPGLAPDLAGHGGEGERPSAEGGASVSLGLSAIGPMPQATEDQLPDRLKSSTTAARSAASSLRLIEAMCTRTALAESESL